MSNETQLGEAFVPIRATLDKLDGDLAQARSKIERAMSGIGKIAGGINDNLQKIGTITMGVAGVVVGALTAIAGAMAFGVKGAMDEQESFVKLQAVIKATGGAANVTAESARKLAEGMSLVTRYTHEEIEAGEAVLLRFKSIGEDVFPTATQTAVDLAASLGIDIPSAALLLGKALEAPGEGLLRLKSAGVAFTDEQQQMIDSMVQAGDKAGAQKYIMDALSKSVGGTAEMMGTTLAGQFQKFKNRLGEAAEAVGNALLPTLQTLFDTVLEPGITIVENIAGAFGDLLTTGDLDTFLFDIRENLTGLVPPSVLDAIINITDSIGTFIQNLINLGGALTEAGLNSSEVQQALGLLVGEDTAAWIMDLITQLQTFAQTVIDFLTPIWAAITQFVSWKDVALGLAIAIGTVIIPIVGSLIASILPVIATAVLVIGAIALLRNAWENDWGGIRTTLTNLWENVLQPAFIQIKDWLEVNIPKAIQILSDFWTNTLQPAIQGVFNWINTVLMPFIQGTVVPWLQKNIPAAIQILSDYWTTVLKPSIQGVFDWINTVLMPFIQGTVVPWLQENIPKAIQILSDFWTNTLQPAIQRVHDWINTVLMPFIQGTLVPWLQEKIPAAIQTLSDFWTLTLKPALEKIWKYFNENILPIIQDVIEIMDKISNLVGTAFAGFWDQVLKPALEKVWKYFNENILPILKDVRDFIQDHLGPKVKWLGDDVFTPLANTIQGGVKKALDWLHDKLDKIKSFLDNFTLPWWLTPGSPTPFELGLVGIKTALSDLDSIMSQSLLFKPPQINLGSILPAMELAGVESGSDQNTNYSSTTYITTNRDPMRVLRASRHLDKLGDIR